MSLRNIDALLHPDGTIVVLGAPRDAPGEALLQQLETLDADRRVLVSAQRDGWQSHHGDALPESVELAIVLDPSVATPQRVSALAARGCRGMIWLAEESVPEAVLEAGRPSTLRVLGPHSAGTTHAQGPVLSAWPRPVAGTTALIAQSRSIASAALDWAEAHAIGFSWTAVTGGEADVDVADLLDHAALDPRTRAVVLQLSQVSSARKFMSAARACARAKPVVVLQTPLPQRAGDALRDPVLSAAFRRAGLLEVDAVTALFDSLAALDRVGEARSGRVAVLGTGRAVGQLACAALTREGLQPALPKTSDAAAMQRRIDGARIDAESIDLGLGDDAGTLGALETVLAAPDIDLAMLVRCPAPGRDDAKLAELLANSSLRQRLVIVLLGAQRSAGARRRCAQAGLAVFPSVEAAARAIRYRRDHRLTQDLLMQMPLLTPLTHALEPSPIVAPSGMPCGVLPAEQARSLLSSYGLCPSPWTVGPEHRGLRVQLLRHREMGMHLRIRLDPAPDVAPTAFALPPLDDVLAGIKLQEAALDRRADAAPGLRVSDYAAALVQVAQMLVEQPLLRDADLRLVPGDGMATVAEAKIRVDATILAERQRLALAPYPMALSHDITLRDGRRVHVRPIRPTDEPALLAMLSQTGAEDIRLRFFRYIRQFTHSMAARMTQIDYDREITFVAVPEGSDRLVGLGTLIFDPDGREGEYAALVQRDYGGQHLGQHLMQDLIDYAAARGATTVYGDVLPENRAMLRLAQKLGFRRESHPDGTTCVRVVIHPTPPEEPPAWTMPLYSARS